MLCPETQPTVRGGRACRCPLRKFVGSDATDAPVSRARAAAGWTDTPGLSLPRGVEKEKQNQNTHQGSCVETLPAEHSFGPHAFFESEKALLSQCTPQTPITPHRPPSGPWGVSQVSLLPEEGCGPFPSARLVFSWFLTSLCALIVIFMPHVFVSAPQNLSSFLPTVPEFLQHWGPPPVWCSLFLLWGLCAW